MPKKIRDKSASLMNKPGTYNTLDILERMQLFAVKHGYGIIKPQLDIFHTFKLFNRNKKSVTTAHVYIVAN